MGELPAQSRVEHRGLRIAIFSAVVILAILGFAILTIASKPSPNGATTTSAQYAVGAPTVVSAAAGQDPSGYILESSKSSPQASSDWAVLGQADGSTANITAVVFGSQNDSQAYFGRLVTTLKGLPGYTDATSALSSYQQYGSCYGYGEVVDGIAVVNGICTKGNILLQVHLVSSKAYSDLEADMTSVMGALYESVD